MSNEDYEMMPRAVLQAMFATLENDVKRRRDFLQLVVSRTFENSSINVKETAEWNVFFTSFIADNLAYFPYDKHEDIVFLLSRLNRAVNHICSLLNVDVAVDVSSNQDTEASSADSSLQPVLYAKGIICLMLKDFLIQAYQIKAGYCHLLDLPKVTMKESKKASKTRFISIDRQFCLNEANWIKRILENTNGKERLRPDIAKVFSDMVLEDGAGHFRLAATFSSSTEERTTTTDTKTEDSGEEKKKKKKKTSKACKPRKKVKSKASSTTKQHYSDISDFEDTIEKVFVRRVATRGRQTRYKESSTEDVSDKDEEQESD